MTLAEFWQQARVASNENLGNNYMVRRIGGSAEAVDRILGNVLVGEKTGTVGLRWLFERLPDTEPSIGSYTVLIDSKDTPRAVIETTGLTEVTVGRMTQQHLEMDGRAPRPLQEWRSIHMPYWAKLLAPYGLAPDDRMPVVIERFRLVYP